MNGLRFCKKVFKYDKKVLSIDMKELGGCFKYNLNEMKVIGRNKTLTMRDIVMRDDFLDDIIGKLVNTNNSLICALICGILGTVWGYISGFKSMGENQTKTEKVLGLTVSTVAFGSGGALIGGMAPTLFVIAGFAGVLSVPVFVFGYVPVLMHEKWTGVKKIDI